MPSAYPRISASPVADVDRLVRRLPGAVAVPDGHHVVVVAPAEEPFSRRSAVRPGPFAGRRTSDGCAQVPTSIGAGAVTRSAVSWSPATPAAVRRRRTPATGSRTRRHVDGPPSRCPRGCSASHGAASAVTTSVVPGTGAREVDRRRSALSTTSSTGSQDRTASRLATAGRRRVGASICQTSNQTRSPAQTQVLGLQSVLGLDQVLVRLPGHGVVDRDADGGHRSRRPSRFPGVPSASRPASTPRSGRPRRRRARRRAESRARGAGRGTRTPRSPRSRPGRCSASRSRRPAPSGRRRPADRSGRCRRCPAGARSASQIWSGIPSGVWVPAGSTVTRLCDQLSPPRPPSATSGGRDDDRRARPTTSVQPSSGRPESPGAAPCGASSARSLSRS